MPSCQISYRVTVRCESPPLWLLSAFDVIIVCLDLSPPYLTEIGCSKGTLISHRYQYMVCRTYRKDKRNLKLLRRD